MRLWHEDLLDRLPRQQLLGQHRECCALRGNGWMKKHATVDYVFAYSPYKLYQYHMKVIQEMKRRGYNNDPLWEDASYRGKSRDPHEQLDEIEWMTPIYKEHDQEYLIECILNLQTKGIVCEKISR
ncbi:hypothetical protein BEP19_15400 [Ammoniphilus oxalaticus]|uniref:Pyrimidine dimer DNA glycosylase n=1 Tax=Ammoniphilus oxalaticus TaxID=66863 RepID=A0A419SD65_9BACL|nr:TIGR02328 family protein [Ammoniphilus oxalaticus]RKD21062.1 hypothetical protein BEP19_15400 [Ammoniphilus oxalaticus]